MKKILSLAFVGLLLAGTVSAQEIPERKSEDAPPKHKMKDPAMRQMKDLGLTEDQKTKMKTLREEYRTKEKDLQSKNLSEQDLRDQRVALHKEQQSKMQSMLTDEQKAKIETAKAQAKKRPEEGRKRGERGDKGRREELTKELNLTADQKTKLEANRKATTEKMKALREDKSITDEQRKEQRVAIMKEQKKASESIFTEDQKKLMKEKRKGGHKKHRKPAPAADAKTV
ncbi:MAG: hypothetical protein EOO18_11605 [Chryseobacterium sp.]|nr:MAG: hypothetical protein EOO18_11605 [Chryseobacterium sp.]